MLDEIVDQEPIYDARAFSEIKKRWDQATYEDARDMIHTDRIVVTIPGVTYREFYKHALDKGYHSVSLSFQFNIMKVGEHKTPGFHELVDNWLKENPKD